MTHPYIPGRENVQKSFKKTLKEEKEGKNEKETNRTDEDPMLIDDEEPDEDRIIKKRKDFPTTLYTPTKENWTKLLLQIF